ncbi:alpha/beta hydrolase [Agrilactobacillus composti]|nr:alpha/beta hydrolase [Agrilactobacillus composti]
MKKRTMLLLALLVSIIPIFGGKLYIQKAQAATYVQQNIPTLFFHGWGGSYHSETQMTTAAKSAGVTDTVVRADVSPKGHVHFVGQLAANAKNPIIQVNYQNNRNGNYYEDGRWAKNVIVALQKQYHFQKMNLVGHSMGNMAIMYYLMANTNDPTLPTLNKQVDIAGHFNGILGMNDAPNQMKLAANGQPIHMDKDYRALLKLRKTYPKQVRVLNIYGDKNDGTHSDGDVSNASSQSLRYLIAKRAQSYTEKKFVGPQAQHSRLHENKAVDKVLIRFLWPQS